MSERGWDKTETLKNRLVLLARDMFRDTTALDIIYNSSHFNLSRIFDNCN